MRGRPLPPRAWWAHVSTRGQLKPEMPSAQRFAKFSELLNRINRPIASKARGSIGTGRIRRNWRNAEHGRARAWAVRVPITLTRICMRWMGLLKPSESQTLHSALRGLRFGSASTACGHLRHASRPPPCRSGLP